MTLFNIVIPVAVVGITVSSFLPSGGQVDGYQNRWESADSFVYYTEERAIYDGVEDGVAYFYVKSTGDVYGAYIYDSELVEGETCNVVFENRETREEYVLAEEYGYESETRADNARLVEIR